MVNQAVILTFTAVLVGLGLANPLLIEPRKFSYLGTMVASQLNTTRSSGEISKRISQYGCYCFRDAHASYRMFGNGQPVDEQDHLCQKLMKCRKCLDMELPGQCDVDMEKYLYNIDPTTKEITCNPDQPLCRYEKCECDKQFAVALGQIWVDEDYNEFNWLNRKNVQRRTNQGLPVLDVDAKCVKDPDQMNNVNDQCCGSVGQKVPYSSARFSCCDGKITGLGNC